MELRQIGYESSSRMSDRTAEKMFWKIPELVDKLISFLDVESVSKL